jgi:hypothetical protein
MDYTGFTRLEIGYAFDVEITRADSFMVQITLDDNLYDYLDISQDEDTLRITMQPGNIYTQATQQAVIHLPDLEQLELSGASQADVSGFVSQHGLYIELSGASQMDGTGISAEDVSLKISGASRITADMAMTNGTFNISGASSMTLDGAAQDIYLNVSGASQAHLDDLTVINVEVDLSGASGATVNASGEISGNLSGVSHLEYIGNPTLGEFNSDDLSSVSPK